MHINVSFTLKINSATHARFSFMAGENVLGLQRVSWKVALGQIQLSVMLVYQAVK